MSGTSTVCSMCGDVGFPDKLFRCARCRHRLQHSYCTNYYGDGAPAEAAAGMCDWCISDVLGKARSPSAPSEAKQEVQGREQSLSTCSGAKGKASGGEQESGRRGAKTAGRRYKLLKDVLC